MNKSEMEKEYSKMLKLAFTDEEFKNRLLTDATSVFKEYGIDVPEDVEIRVVANTDRLFYFVLPNELPSVHPHKYWASEPFDDFFRLTFKDSEHEKSWEEIQEEDKEVYHSVG